MNYELIMERRKQAAIDGKAEAIKHNLNKEETRNFLFDADSNAIWDAEAGLPYTPFLYVKKPEEPNEPQAIYSELGFLSDEEYKQVTGRAR
jgi:hypothetical protein